MALPHFGGSMNHDSLLCVDTETMPDRPVLPADRFPPPHRYQIVAISSVEAAIDRSSGAERCRVTECRSGGDLAYDEERLICGFRKRFTKTPLRVVTWIGRGFVLPVLRLRAIVYGVPVPARFQTGGKRTGCTRRYQPDYNCDFMEKISSHAGLAKKHLQWPLFAVAQNDLQYWFDRETNAENIR